MFVFRILHGHLVYTKTSILGARTSSTRTSSTWAYAASASDDARPPWAHADDASGVEAWACEEWDVVFVTRWDGW